MAPELALVESVSVSAGVTELLKLAWSSAGLSQIPTDDEPLVTAVIQANIVLKDKRNHT